MIEIGHSQPALVNELAILDHADGNSGHVILVPLGKVGIHLLCSLVGRLGRVLLCHNAGRGDCEDKRNYSYEAQELFEHISYLIYKRRSAAVINKGFGKTTLP